jgi:cell division protein FtsI (penicillin-binding protein 3)
MVQAVYENYKNNPSKFVNHVNSYGLNKKLDFEGKPVIPQPSDKTGLIFPSLDGLRLWSQ